MTLPTTPQPGHCADFSRAELLRATMASAMPGAGLPSIDRGMPVPAGTGLTRRSFVTRTSGLALAVFGAGALSPRLFEEGIATASAAVSRDGRILVSIFCSGGLDSMSLLAPVGDPQYAALRPNLAVAPSGASADVFTQDDRLHWHPRASALRDLHRAGKVTVIPAVGYASPNQSHFTSRHFWELGELSTTGRVGWLGRFLDQHGSADNPLQGLSLNQTLAPSLAPASAPVAAVASPRDYSLALRDVWDHNLRSRVQDGLAALGRLPTTDPQLAMARRTASNIVSLRESLAILDGAAPATVPYPSADGFPGQLSALAEMIDVGLPLRCVALDANGGYDTHDDQAGSLPGNIELLSGSLAAFQADLEARGLGDRVLVHVWSEFGRRARENGTGTDHGAAGLSLVIGTQARGELVGEFPGLGSAGLDASGNLRATTDFRGVYCSLLEQWFGVGADGIIPGAGGFGRPSLVRV